MTALVLPAVRGDLSPCVLARYTAVQRVSADGPLGWMQHKGSASTPTTSVSAVEAGEGSSQLDVPTLPAPTRAMS